MSLTTISYGGGVQSTAMLVLASQGKLGHQVTDALFANVGDDSEHPATLEYIRNIAIPYGEQHGITVHELHRVKRDGSRETLHQRLMRGTSNGRVSDTIPVRGTTGMPMGRACTADFKIKVVGKWLKANGATDDNPATVCIGISTDEVMRASNKRAMPYEHPVYPLIQLGYDRSTCAQIIRDAGLPVPPKSSCYFCPFHRPQMWAEMRRDEPDLFWKSVALEKNLNDRRAALGRDPMWFTRFGKPLDEAIPEAQDVLPIFAAGPDTATCDEGYCWT